MSIDRSFEKQHVADILAQNREIARILNQAAATLAKDIARAKLRNPATGNVYSWNQVLADKIDATLASYAKFTEQSIQDAVQAQWELANQKNDELVKAATAGLNVSPAALSNMSMLNLNALKMFQTRKTAGMNLSERVWNLAWQNKDLLEKYLASGITTGRSAVAISRDIRQLLNEPDKLFRRVRNSKGDLVLSKAAAAYHPGRGVYRSSYQNALRLSATETNMAYRASDSILRQELPFVTGIVVHLSAAHTEPDICDSMAGEYPTGFWFEGWHSRCLCYTTSELLPRSEVIAYLKGGEIDGRVYRRAIPEKAQRYLATNAEKIAAYKNQPYFMKNFEGANTLRPEVLDRTRIFNPYEKTK